MNNEAIKVLLISKDSEYRDNLRKLLSEIGGNFFSLAGQEYALEHLEDIPKGSGDQWKGRLDFIILDMPFSGRTCLEALSMVYAKAANIPIIVLLEKCDVKSETHLIYAGASDYLVKDYLNATLLGHSLLIAKRQHSLFWKLAQSKENTEKLLKKYNEELELEVRKKTKELELAKFRAEQANKAKSEFLSNMSHELRTPLNAVIGFSEVLYDQKFGPLNETQKDYLTDILESGKHLLSLINDILDLAKIESGKTELTLSDFSLKELLEHSFVFIKEKALKHNIELSLDVAEEVGYIRADERKVRQIVFNLLSNAVKFTPDGGKIGINAKITGPEVEVAVWDTGVGITKKDQDKLFSKFVQLENPLTKKYKGSGLGLSLVKKLVELHGGHIWVESEGKNKGSSFKFSLPIKGE